MGKFTDSFVRQMGRNVANTIYSEATAKTFTITDNQHEGEIVNTTNDEGKTVNRFIFDDVDVIGWKNIIAWVILAALPLFLNQLWVVCFMLPQSLRCLLSKKIRFKHSHTAAVYASDRRYKSGARFDGYTLETVKSKHTIEELNEVDEFVQHTINERGAHQYALVEKEKQELLSKFTNKYRLNGVISLLIAVEAVVMVIVLLNWWKSL